MLYLIQTDGYTSKQLREPLAQLLGIAPAMITRARMTYDLRRLRLHGLIERFKKTHRFRVTPDGRGAPDRVSARGPGDRLSSVRGEDRPRFPVLRRKSERLPERGGRSFEAEILRRHRWKDAIRATKLSLVIPSGR